MKRFFLNIFCLLAVYALQGQVSFQIDGTVTRSSDGSAVADWMVFAYAGDPSDSTVFIFESAVTDASGAYLIQFPALPPGVTEFTVSTFNGCINAPDQVFEQAVMAGTSQATVDFQICGDQPVTPDCEVYGWYMPAGGLAI
ncbi:MAG: hypothetical protein KDC61_14525, partial [Saprospiraceae bacterium]|nr:hypothetical protein [Saprospiraceae bacterium]